MKITKIRTHPGHAHRDDFLACCVALAVAEGEPTIIRSDEIPTEAFEDPETWILDVGGRHDPDLNNFDHHQLPKDHDAVCAFTLVLRKLGIYDDALQALPWVRMLEIWDSKGPMSASKYLEYEQLPMGVSLIKDFLIERVGSGLLKGRHKPAENASEEVVQGLVDRRATKLAKALNKQLKEKSKTWEKVMVPMLSPVDSFVLNDFQNLGVIEPMYSIWEMMREIGAGILQSIADFKEMLKNFVENGKVAQVGSIEVLISPETSRNNNNIMGAVVEAWRSRVAPDAAVSIAPDERGAGYSLYRFDDDPRVDFRWIEGIPGIKYVHVNGFIAKTETRDIEQALKFVEMAIRR